jgi:YNFM family putative membrane transporter
MASAVYLFCYYLGSSSIGSLTGQVWARLGWNGVLGTLAFLLILALAAALRLHMLHAAESTREVVSGTRPSSTVS